MSDLTLPRRLSPRAKASLGFFARYATIIGLVAMIAAFAMISPRAFPTVNNFTNVLNQASLTMIIAVENERSRFNAALGLASQGYADRCELAPLAVPSTP